MPMRNFLITDACVYAVGGRAKPLALPATVYLLKIAQNKLFQIRSIFSR
ncbi:MAG: hypothetical protein LBJ00_18685 [Planctomycetaceae bacterium]|nr:hypothetical protein [Planctomycetaceae bacterium]